MTERTDKAVVVPFPGPRPRPPAPLRQLGLSALSRAAGPMQVSPRGHWCGRCEGVWYSYFAEARCPVCGGRG